MEEAERKRETKQKGLRLSSQRKNSVLCIYPGLLIIHLLIDREFQFEYFEYRFSFFESESHFSVDEIYKYGLNKALNETTEVAMPPYFGYRWKCNACPWTVLG